MINIYTRHDLEEMQVKRLDDILKILPGFHLTRTTNNLTSLQKPTLSTVQLTSIRLYINDHDMSSSSFGSAFLIWGELPIEYIDHIEVYKGASSIEFGNETGSVIIKLYTKTAKREEGGKIRFYGDNYGSANLDTYIASSTGELSYFAYANLNNINREDYYNTYENKTYELNSNRKGHNLYANLQYKKWILELGSYYKQSNDFLGRGIHYTPTGGELDAYHHYLHLTKKFQNNLKLQLSYDNASYDRTYLDPNGIQITDAPLINDFDINFNDEIFSIVVDKKITKENHSLLLGTFYKRKKFSVDGSFISNSQDYSSVSNFANALNLYSLYAEYTYNYNTTTRVIASLKEDIFKYQKTIASNNELVTKLGLIKHIQQFQFKAFITNSYIPTAFYQLYNPDNTPYKANPNLKNMHLLLGTFSIHYKVKKHHIKFVVARNQIKDSIVYNPAAEGFVNSPESHSYTRLELLYNYIFDLNNRFSIDLFCGENNKDVIASPKYASIIQLFNKYKKFDIYNELVYKSAYDYFGLSMDASFDYTASIKYHYNRDLSIGLRGENIFKSGYKQAYQNFDYAIPVSDQKIWFNLEYLF